MEQKALVLPVVLNGTTTFDEQKCLNRSGLSYTIPNCERRCKRMVFEEDEEWEEGEDDGKKKKRKLTSVRDSVRTLGLCKKINK